MTRFSAEKMLDHAVFEELRIAENVIEREDEAIILLDPDMDLDDMDDWLRRNGWRITEDDEVYEE